jgi:hypothetical protein
MFDGSFKLRPGKHQEQSYVTSQNLEHAEDHHFTELQGARLKSERQHPGLVKSVRMRLKPQQYMALVRQG